MNYNKYIRGSIIISIIILSVLGIAFVLDWKQNPKPTGPIFIDVKRLKRNCAPLIGVWRDGFLCFRASLIICMPSYIRM